MTDTSLPGDQNITFDLDAAERPKDEVKTPFVARVGGKLVTMIDPEEFDWKDLLDLQNPVDFLRYCFSDDDREHIRNQDMKAWQLNQLMEQYMKYYGINKKVEKYEREQRGNQL